MNDRIRVTPVKVVNEKGVMLGEMPTEEAMRLAAEAEMDLVEVSADARPPICRIMDYGKVQYDQQKKKSSGHKHRVQLKQIRLRAKIGQHDIDFKVRQAEQFLKQRHKVKFSVLFRGRENAHHDRGRELLEEIVQTLEPMATVEQPIKMEGGRMMSVMLTPHANAATKQKQQAS